MLLRGPRMVTPDGVVDGGEVEVADGRIGAVRAAPGAAEATDLGPGWLVPGFVDLHCHGGGGASFASTDTDEIASAASFHAAHGTTAMLASLVSDDVASLCAQLDAIATVVDTAATPVVGAHLEGPFLSAARCGAQNPTHLINPDVGAFADLLAAARGTLRMLTIAPELPGADLVIDAALAAGVVVAVGHTDADVDTADQAFRRGARVATHLFNGMPPIHHREPGPAAAALATDAVCELINDGHHVHPAMLRVVGPTRAALITDAIAAAGVGDGAYRLGGLDVVVTDGVARLRGKDSLAGSTLTMDDAVRRAVTRTGWSLAEAITAAATNPALVLGLDRGAIAAGLRADLVHLDEQLRVVSVLT
ncbi:MAG TPA: N-acetylglucosamine-6-phosphate deacetylase [Jatrophihabitans sp.]|jgi:N-acetylglucosamine-6-phosphate deacetylase